MSSRNRRCLVIWIGFTVLMPSSGIMAAPGRVRSAAAATAPVWQQAQIGAESGPRTLRKAGSAIELSGGGAGLDVRGADQAGFAYVARQAGDFEVVARLIELAGDGDVTAGITARQDVSTTANMAAVYCSSKNRSVTWKTRTPGPSPKSAARVITGGIELARPLGGREQAPPLWLRMVRMGDNFAVYKSRNGRFWLPISNVSGGPFAARGPLKIGLFVANGGGNTPARAKFDSVRIGPAQMRYRTSWVGNSFGSRDADSHVSNGLSAMWVAPDGTCYTSSYWDEGGQPVTSYRNGKVWRALPIGTPQTYEGAIAGDAKYVYVAAVDQIVRLDPAAPDFAPFPMPITTSLLDRKLNQCVVSGMASNGRELFVADSRENCVRVLATETIANLQVAMAANDGIRIAPSLVRVPDGPGYAPPEVYQTQRMGEGYRYTLPGFTPGERYTLRCHLADYVDHPGNADPRNRLITINGVEFNVGELAGGTLRACYRDFPGAVANPKGEIVLDAGSYGGPGLCGIEVRDKQDRRVFALNCGGIPIGDFKGESQELRSRTFAFDRPGAMACDRRGDLWIVQRANDVPIGNGTAVKYAAAVQCYRPDGTFTGRQITDVINPRALGYDAAKDELLVAENGPDLNVRIFGGLDTEPTRRRTFGAPGGIFSGSRPGVVCDPAAGGYARFAGIAGLGVDAAGNLYVGGGIQGTDLRCFRPDGRLGWMVNSLVFCNTYDVDPASDGTELYATYNHLRLDLDGNTRGASQQYVGYNWDMRRFGEPDRPANSQSILRRLGPGKRLVMYTTGQGDVGEIKLFRYEHEIAVPAGGVVDGGNGLWIDANGDGKLQPEEVTRMASPLHPTALCVDTRGDMWAVSTTTAGSFMRRFRYLGMNRSGVPLYSGAKGAGYEDVPFPEEGATVNGWGMASRMDYDADRDILIAFYPAVPRKGENDRSPSQYWMARYDNWSKGNRKPLWKIRALRPETDGDYFMYEVNLFPYSGYMGLQIAGDYVFFAYLFGEVHVFDLKTGRLVEVLSPGPEVNGQSAWEDASMGLRAFRRRNGEYLIFTENSGWGGKNNLYRWKP